MAGGGGGITIKREQLLGELGTGRGRSVRFRLVEYDKGGVRLDIRQYFADDSGASVPTSKGCGIKLEHIAELKRAIAEFEREAEALRSS